MGLDAASIYCGISPCLPSFALGSEVLMVEVWLLLGIGVFFDSPLCGANSWVNASLPSLFLPSSSPP